LTLLLLQIWIELTLAGTPLDLYYICL